MSRRNIALLLALIWTFFPRQGLALSTQDFWIPQAHTLVPTELKFDLQQRFTLDKTGGSIHRGVWGLGYGILKWGAYSIEAGLDWREPTSTTTAAAISAHARMVMNDVREDGWAVALGVDQVGFHPGQNDYNVNYLVFQNMIGDEWEMAFGGFTGNSTFLFGDDKGMVAGFWKDVQSGHGRMGVEWMSGNSDLGYFVPGLKVEVRDGVMGYLAYGFANRRDVFKDWLSMRVSILF